MKCLVEIFQQNRWQPACEFSALQEADVSRGFKGGGHFHYDIAYAADHLGDQAWSVSCCYPVNFELHRLKSWPSFLLDILPSGVARREWLRRLALRDGPDADWLLLTKGGGNPIGNLRIGNALESSNLIEHAGFAYQEVLIRGENFIEYAKKYGAPVAGSSGALGDAPKFLLTEDVTGNWHADGALSDKRSARHWLAESGENGLS